MPASKPTWGTEVHLDGERIDAWPARTQLVALHAAGGVKNHTAEAAERILEALETRGIRDPELVLGETGEIRLTWEVGTVRAQIIVEDLTYAELDIRGPELRIYRIGDGTGELLEILTRTVEVLQVGGGANAHTTGPGTVGCMQRIQVSKTAKAYVGGKFIRSESGHTYRVETSGGPVEVVNGSRKDTRDAIRSAVSGAQVWSGSGGYLRGQILYRLAEMLEGREELDAVAERCALRGGVQESADLAVRFAGFCDKLGAMLGSVNDPNGFASSTEVRPVGVSCTWHGPDSSLVDLVRSGCAALAAGNAVLQIVEGPAGLLACTLGEVLAVSDIPAGAWQVLPAVRRDPILTAAGASDIKALDVVGHLERKHLEELHAEALGRARISRGGRIDAWGLLEEIRWQVEYTSTWQPIGR